MKRTLSKNSKGFTLIELLIVIAIIGILSSVVLASLNAARLKARNAQRISQLKQVEKALEFYYDDHGSYPDTSGWPQPQCSWGNAVGNDLNTRIPGLVPTYIPTLTPDPTYDSATCQSSYAYASDGNEYSFFIQDIADPTNGFNYGAYPAFIPPYRDGGSDLCSLDGAGYSALGVWSEGACSYAGDGSPW